MRHTAAMFLALILLPLVMAAGSEPAAGRNVWVTHGPPGQVETITVAPSDPSRVFAGTLGGAYRSKNQGASWTNASVGLTPVIFELEVDPTNPLIAYAGTFQGGVFKTTSGGGSWTPINNGITGRQIEALAIDPSSPSTLYASSFNVGVYKSVDGGASWFPSTGGQLTDDVIVSFAIDRSNPQRVFAGGDGDVFRTLDGGAHWSHVFHGNQGRLVFGLEIDPQDPNIVYFTDYLGGVYKSTDGGDTWANKSKGMNDGKYLWSLAIDPVDPNRLYAGNSFGLYQSDDAAETWTEATGLIDGDSVQDLAVDPANHSVVWAATSNDVYWTQDAGATWLPRSNGVSGMATVSLSVSSNAFVQYAVDGYGFQAIRRSTDRGRSWETVEVAPGIEPYRVAQDPTNSSVVYVATIGDGIYKTTDGGETWASMNNGLVDDDIRAIAIDPTAPSIIFAGGYGQGLFKSTDGGSSWSLTGLHDGINGAIAVSPSDPSTIYVHTGLAVELSRDGGASWSRIDHGFCDRSGYDVAVDALDPDTAIVATGSCGIYVTHDAGATWTHSSGLDEGFNTVAISPDGDTYMAGTYDGVHVSQDGGVTWSLINEGLTDVYTYTLEVNGKTGNVYGGFGAEGVAVRAIP